jgi:Uma2 family endonuclease
MDLAPENKKYSYADYLKWDDGRRWEVINGIPYSMSPPPSRRHQGLLTNLIGEFAIFLKGKECKAYVAPFDVRLPDTASANEEESFNIVQPDLVVYCDLDKLDERGAIGAPDLAVEILSPSSSMRDLNEKFALYERSGVREYWIVHPHEQTVTVFVLEKGRFVHTGLYSNFTKIRLHVLPDFVLDLSEVFEDLRPAVEEPPVVYRV